MSAVGGFIPGASAFSVALSPSSVTGFGNSGASANITTGAAVATPSGGVAPYTYAWTQDGVSSVTWTIGAPAAATTSFTANSVPAGNFAEVLFLVTVTDSVGSKATATVDATANNGLPYDPSQDQERKIGGQLQ